MKIRNGFVTNSSSSSFVSVTIDNPLFATLVSKYEEFLSDDYGCVNVFVDEDSVSINIEEGYADVPNSLDKLFDAVISIFDEEYYYDEDDECDDDEEEFDDDAEIPEGLDGFKFEIKKNIEELKNQTEYAEFECSDMGWQGDSDSRYYQDNYDEETLKEMFETIAAQKGCSVDNVTDEDFGNYVSDKTSTDSTTFTYSKETGEETVSHSFYVE